MCLHVLIFNLRTCKHYRPHPRSDAGFVVSPVDSMTVVNKVDSNASLRDASNTVDAHSPRVSAQRPTAKEIAAARAARIRLGYEVDDSGKLQEVCVITLRCCSIGESMPCNTATKRENAFAA